MSRIISGVLGIILASLVLYLTWDNNRLSGIIEDYSLLAIQASEKARLEQVEQQRKIAEYEAISIKAQERESDRLSKLSRRTDIVGCNDGVVRDYYGLFNEAANNPALQQAEYSREIGQGEDATTIILDSAQDYGSCATDYNDLLRLAKASECFN